MKLAYGEEKVEIKARLPVLTMRDVVIFPHMIYPLLVGRRFTIAAMQQALVTDKQIFLCAQKTAEMDNPGRADLYPVGVVARILQVMKLPNGTMKVLVEGICRGKIKNFNKTRGYYQAGLEIIRPDLRSSKELEAVSRTVIELFTDYVRLNRRIPDEILLSVTSIEDYQRLADTISAHILQKMETKQLILGMHSVADQLEKISSILRSEIEILKIEQKIEGTVSFRQGRASTHST